MHIAIVSDAWRPQINGVVRTIETVVRLLQAEGHEVEVFGPDRFRTLPCPTYPEIRLSLMPGRRLSGMLDDFAPDRLHICSVLHTAFAMEIVGSVAAQCPGPTLASTCSQRSRSVSKSASTVRAAASTAGVGAASASWTRS